MTFLILTYLLISFQIGLRWETGTDWIPYLVHFESIDTFESTSPLNTGMEFGYSILCWLVKLFTNKYTLLLIVHSLIYYAFIFKGIKKLSPYIFPSILLFYAFTMGVMGSHRQLLAISFVLYSIKFIINRDIYRFFGCILFATAFHTTAIICIPIYFLNTSWNKYLLMGLVFGAFLLGRTSLPYDAFKVLSSFGGVGDKVMFYLEGGIENAKEYSVSTIGLIKRIVFVIIFIYARKILTLKMPYYNLILNTYILGILLYFLFSSSLTILVSRGSLYFNMFEPILIVSQFLLFKSHNDKIIVMLLIFFLSILYFFQSIAQYPDLFIPYKGLFINSEYTRDLR